MRYFLRDVFYGIRLLRRSPAFTSLAAAIIALGIGAATAIFSLIYGVVLNALPFRAADSKNRVHTHYFAAPPAGGGSQSH